jgi:uncharacterized protein
VISTKRPFVVPFIGLKIGKHNFDYELDKAFFEKQGFDKIQSADIKIQVELDKKETMLIFQFHLEGQVGIPCDRCTDTVEHDLGDSYRWVYKFGTEESGDENLIVLHPDSYEIDLTEAFYELTIVSLPSRIQHEGDECDQEMMESIEKYVVNLDDDEEEDIEEEEEEEEDPRSPWDILKDLKR